MRRIRAIAIVVCAILTISLFIAFLVPQSPAPVTTFAHGRGVYENGSVGYGFLVTNHTSHPLEVMVARNNAPTGMVGFAFSVHATMSPKTIWHVVLRPPEEGVRWSATVRYMPRAGKIERRLRQAGAWLRLCKREPQWKVAETIECKRWMPPDRAAK